MKNNVVSGNFGDGGPLKLSNEQRKALTAKMGLGSGWLLLSLQEMLEMKKAMDHATVENSRLNGELAKVHSRHIQEEQRLEARILELESFVKELGEKE